MTEADADFSMDDANHIDATKGSLYKCMKNTQSVMQVALREYRHISFRLTSIEPADQDLGQIPERRTLTFKFLIDGTDHEKDQDLVNDLPRSDHEYLDCFQKDCQSTLEQILKRENGKPSVLKP